DHLIDALNQLGADAFCKKENSVTPPYEFTGPISNENILFTEGKLSQYISGFMMAATRMTGLTQIQLTNPQETPYLSMTKYWLDKYGVQSSISDDYKSICVAGPVELKAEDVTIPSDWEAVAFPLIAALIANEQIVITDIDDSGTQGDEKIVDLLKDYGADIEWNKKEKTITVNKNSFLSAPDGKKKISMAEYPDAICALCVIACFAEGKTVFTDIDICRKKETDRIKVMTELLSSLGADIKDNGDTLVINGHSPVQKDRSKNEAFALHGGAVDSYLDHRVAMSLACMGLYFTEENAIVIKDAECCNVSFPHFFDVMNESLGCEFRE
ncbi:MAG: 3-phosphoshikimate 1-carboxyvinyltransferase, partial [Treponema sp.]|nr:3-phosphoshikimate 1-carboxyvinyltransferase [Treponema sp.]